MCKQDLCQCLHIDYSEERLLESSLSAVESLSAQVRVGFCCCAREECVDTVTGLTREWAYERV